MSQDTISNFINLSDLIYLLSPEDSNISHDIPFKNHYSGEIIVTITSKTPIYIRNSYVKGDDYYETKDKDNKKQVKSLEFCHYKKQRYIPGSSVKGMISNVLEILSFGKLGTRMDSSNLSKLGTKLSEHTSSKLDLAEAIFGTVELKGRVQFSHFKAQNNPKQLDKIKTILMTPAPKVDKIGWKKYPIMNVAKPDTKQSSANIFTEFRPLVVGAIFKGKVRFQNLRDFELGGLLSALTLHNQTNAFHNIGMAKSQGYGKILLKVKYDEKEKFLKAFEEKMNIELFEATQSWHWSKPIQKLYEKHTGIYKPAPIYSSEESLLKYKLDNKEEIDHHGNEKKLEIVDFLTKFKNKIQNPRGVRQLLYLKQLPKQLNISEEKINTIINEENIKLNNDFSLKTNDVCIIIDKFIEDLMYPDIKISRLGEELNVTMEKLLIFAEEETISIDSEYDFISVEIANMIREYINA